MEPASDTLPRPERRTAEDNHRVTGGFYGTTDRERFYALRPARDPIARSQSTDSMGDTTLSPPPRYRDGMTIRAVTPEAEDSVPEVDDGAPTPPRTPSRSTNRGVASRWDLLNSEPSSPEKMKGLQHRSSITMAELGITRAKSRSPTERMWRSPEESNSYVARQRYNAHNMGPSSAPTSVGFPSTQQHVAAQLVSSPVLTSRQPTKPPSRRLLKTQNSVGTLGTLGTMHTTRSAEPPSPVTDYDTLIRLMNTTKGKMEGYAEYRIGDNMMWTRGFCAIHAEQGSLMYRRDEHSPETPVVVVSDLRGCEVRTDDGILELRTHFSKMEMKLRPLNVLQFEHWLAALLCWTPIRPAGVQNKRVKPHMLVLAQDKGDRRRKSDAALLPRDAAIIKVSQMKLWRPGGVTTPHHHHRDPKEAKDKDKGKMKVSHGVAWQDISCTLQENGELRLYRQNDATLLTVIQLSQLSRCAVQQLDPSILDLDFCIAIYPQYTPASTRSSASRPVYLGVQTRIFFEVWFVLLRAFTMPELYGPAGAGAHSTAPILEVPPATVPKSDGGFSDLYRNQRSLFLRIVEAKISTTGDKEPLDCYAEVMLDQEVRAKTMVRTKTHNPFWREDYEFCDLPAVLSDVAVVLKQRDPKWKTNPKASGSVAGSGGFGGGLGGSSMPGSRDMVLGRVEIQLSTLTADNNKMERWFPLMVGPKNNEERVGEMFLKVELEELVVLTGAEYQQLSNLLHHFDTGLTMKLARVMSADLRRLADTLLKIFQVSNYASEWLMSLAENEIDGLYKEAPLSKLPSSHGSSHGSDAQERPAVSPTVPKGPTKSPSVTPSVTTSTTLSARSGLVDANILFRGNSLLTKGLDAHMKRLGREYLEETLGPSLQKIAEEDTHCEVDPMRIDKEDNLSKNWRTLMNITRAVWQAIYQSPTHCPAELRRVLKHIRACVEDRYGDVLRSVSYSSVCGFLFLRFFCPAILNPKLFGLLKDHPGVRAQRTLTLIAKSLQGLANMTTFGVKEPWMSPMNEFLTEHTAELKDFVDTITAIPPPAPASPPPVPPSYATPFTILARLSPPAKEGFPSLPYLIDQPRALANLVVMWMRWKPDTAGDPDLVMFDAACRAINDRMEECFEKAEIAERPGEQLAQRWEEVAERASGAAGMRQGMREEWSHTAAGRGGEQGRSKLSGFVGGWRKMVKPGRFGEED